MPLLPVLSLQPPPHLLSPLSPRLHCIPAWGPQLCRAPRPRYREIKEMEKGCSFSPVMCLRFWWMLGLVHQVTIRSLKLCAWCVGGAPRQDRNQGQNPEDLASDFACVFDLW